MKTKNKIMTAIALFAVFLITSCSSNQIESFSGDNLELSGLVNKLTDDEHKRELIISEKGVSDPTIQIPKSRDDLNKMRTVVQIFNGKENAGILLPGFGGLRLGKDESSLNVYYIETKVVNNVNDSIVYGCGYSIHYLFKKVEKGISVNDMPSVAASAQLNNKKTQVFYSFQTYGIIGNNLVKYFKPTVNINFNVEGFGIMQSSIDGIHNVLGDSVLSKTVKFEPEILKFVKAYELEQF